MFRRFAQDDRATAALADASVGVAVAMPTVTTPLGVASGRDMPEHPQMPENQDQVERVDAATDAAKLMHDFHDDMHRMFAAHMTPGELAADS